VDEATSARAARRLIAGGLDPRRVAVLLGGIQALHGAGYPIRKWNDPA
jgi:rhodanese-related sulfurtransferase